MVTGHNDQPKKFLLAGYVSFLTSQNIGKKVNSSLCFKGNKNLRFTSEDLDVDIWMRVCVTGQHDLQTKFLARQVNCYSSWTLSVDWLFFWALMSVTSWRFANSYQGAKKTFLQLPIRASWSQHLLAQMSFQLAPKAFWRAELITQFLLFEFLKTHQLPIGQVKNRIH